MIDDVIFNLNKANRVLNDEINAENDNEGKITDCMFAIIEEKLCQEA